MRGGLPAGLACGFFLHAPGMCSIIVALRRILCAFH